MSLFHIAGVLISISFIAGMAIYSGMKAKNKNNPSNNGAGIVAGIIMGTIVGGSSTVGTAQLAYHFGMAAWWFTLGGGLACLVLTFAFCGPFRESGCTTLVGIIAKEYGRKAGMAASVLNSIGTFINIISQLFAASAVLLIIIPGINIMISVIIAALSMIFYVIFGGTKGAGMVGMIKLLLLYLTMAICSLIAIDKVGGIRELIRTVETISEITGIAYFSLFARGVSTDLGACLSLILGVLTTQTYAQAVMSADSETAARKGGLISALLVPPIGVAGIIVGLYMRTVTDPAVFDAKTALTEFIIRYLPGLPGGIALGTLFIASVGTGAGLALGIATIMNHEIISKVTNRFVDDQKSERLQRAIIIIVMILGCLMSSGALGDIILNFAFMSMGLRGAVVFMPMCFAIWGKGHVRTINVILSCIISPFVVLIFGTLWKGVLPFDALFAGIFVSAVIMLSGFHSNSQ